MELAALNVFQALARRLNWLGQRQEVLAQNIANADTPDFVPRDLRQGSFERSFAGHLAEVKLAATHPRHVAGSASQAPQARFGSEDQRERYETAPSGNAVVLEEQLATVAETQMEYQTMTNLYRKHLEMMRTALGRSGS